tara:strand:+ start:16806 stop:19085 length:2280 start_codon:yes stop_codon:yes gene_type:complete
MLEVVTSIHKGGMESYGEKMLASVVEHWAEDMHLTVWYHDHNIFEFTIPDSDRISYRNLNEVQDMLDYKENFSKYDGNYNDQPYNWRMDAIKWCHKVFAMTEQAFEMADDSAEAGWLVWLDADTITTAPVCEQDILSMVELESEFVHLGRTATDYSETSFMMFNLNMEPPLQMLGDLRGAYQGGEVMTYREWHDGFIITRLINIYRAHGMAVCNLSPDCKDLNAFNTSELHNFFHHYKGNTKPKKLSDTQVAPDVTGPKRYRQLSDLVHHYGAKNIVEVGTWNGGRAIEMALSSFKKHDSVFYYGFDLFEEATEESDSLELNSKAHNTLAAVDKRLNDFAERMADDGKMFEWELYKGDTKETLKDFDATNIDLAYIDGGHSIETCQSDYDFLKDVDVVVMDDYFSEDTDGGKQAEEHLGTNKVIEGITKEDNRKRIVLPSQDRVIGGGHTHLAVILTEGMDEVPIELRRVPIIVNPKDCVPSEYIQNNVQENMKLIDNYDWVHRRSIHKKPAFIISGGASIDFDLLKAELKMNPDAVTVCVKHSYPTLMEQGITPDYCVILDPRPIDGVSTHGIVRKDLFKNINKTTKFLVASMTDPSVTKYLQYYKADVYGWHAYTDSIRNMQEQSKIEIHEDVPIPEGATLVTGGTAAAMRAIGMFHILGFRYFHLFGFDCSYMDIDKKKVEFDTTEDGDPKYFQVETDGDIYWTTGELLAMAQDCEKLFERKDLDMNITFHGEDTLIGTCYRNSPKAKEVKWDGIK